MKLVFKQKWSKIMAFLAIILWCTNTTFSQVNLEAYVSMQQTSCSNLIKIKIKGSSGTSNLYALDYGVTWDAAKLQYVGHEEYPLAGGNDDFFSTNTSMVSSGQFGYNWGNNGSPIPLIDTDLVELTFVVLSTGTADVTIEDNDVTAFEAYDEIDLVQIVVPINPLSQSISQASLGLVAETSGTLPSSCGDELTIQIKVGSCFTDLISLQYSVCWNPALLQYTGYTFPTNPGTDAPFTPNTTNTSVGQFGYQWGALTSPNDLDGVDLVDGTALIELKFNVLAVGAPMISFCDMPLVKEAFDNNIAEVAINGTSSTALNSLAYNTIADGDYNTPATWAGGCLPPNPVPPGVTVNMAHDVTIPVGHTLTNNGLITIPSGHSLIVLGTLKGNGTVNGAVANSGSIEPGN